MKPTRLTVNANVPDGASMLVTPSSTLVKAGLSEIVLSLSSIVRVRLVLAANAASPVGVPSVTKKTSLSSCIRSFTIEIVMFVEVTFVPNTTTLLAITKSTPLEAVPSIV